MTEALSNVTISASMHDGYFQNNEYDEIAFGILGVALAFFGCLCVVHHEVASRHPMAEWEAMERPSNDPVVGCISYVYKSTVDNIYNFFSFLAPRREADWGEGGEFSSRV
ncbi:MAG: hypothetical protein KR126chlam1_00426 [Chlamydiae bacterium]|nr:hypothetical protein [Chlamydiota bacterium]